MQQQPGTIPPRTAKQRKRRMNLIGWCFLLPSFIGFVLFRFLPIIASFLLSFTKWNLVSGFSGIEFVGLSNFTDLVTDDTFLVSLKNTFLYVIGSVPAIIVIAIVLAVIVNNKIYLKSLSRLMIYMPYIFSMVTVSMVWLSLYSPNYGPINNFLRRLGIENPPGWVTSSKSSLAALVIIGVWSMVGYYMVIFMAGLQNIPASYYEAAEIDGAGSIYQFFKITLPMLSPTTFYVMITCIINSFQVFTAVKIMTEGGPGTSSMVTVYYVYNLAVKYNKIGYACAVSMVLFVLVFLITIFQFKMQKKWVYQE